VADPAKVHSWGTGTPRTDAFSYPLYRELRDHNDVFSRLQIELAGEVIIFGARESGGEALLRSLKNQDPL
jgi:hypothetical protein